tara:strand:+ start:2401 stop:3642 length:1242 start_codon:yes stop_codon:yes gene_type:complete
MENKEKPIVDDTVEKLKVKETPKENQVEKPKIDESKFDSAGDKNVVKIDLDSIEKPDTQNETTEETKENNTDDARVVELVEDTEPVQEQKEVQSETETQEQPVVEEVTEEEVTEQKVEELETEVTDAIVDSAETGKPLPENVQKLVDFMEETGGDINDYVKLNTDYSKYDDSDLLFEYYKQTKPHLNLEEINFLLEDQFSYDEEIDEEKDIKRKKLAFKEQVANAKSHLDGQKSKYYEDIKAGSKLTKEQQKAIDFFNRYNKESEANKKAAERNTEIFTNETNKVFNNKFKGFEYNVGDKRYRFNVKNAEEVKNLQSDLSNFTKKFLDKKMALKDAVGYHKSLYTAMNADAIAKHFYEQGKADAMKDSITKSKNIDMSPRQAHEDIRVDGIKARIVGESSSDFKFKIRNRNKN